MSRRNWALGRGAMAALALMVVLPGCGGGGSSGGGNTNAPTTPAAPVRSLIGNFNFAVAGVPEANRNGLQRDYYLQQLTINESGSLEVIADWTFSSNDIDVELFRGACTPALITSTGCPLVAGTTSVTAKPERLTTSVTPGVYTVGITNYGNSNESGVGQVFLTR